MKTNNILSLLDTEVLRDYCAAKTSELLEGESFQFHDNGSKILAVAHCDYVRLPFRFDVDGPIVYSPRLDDRLGVYLIREVLEKIGVVCDWLFTEGEESGCSTAHHFEASKDYHWIIELDRAGTDAVTYSYDEMIPYVEKHFPHGFGSYSDISSMRHLGVGAFNAGIGYYQQHTEACHCDLNTVAQCLEQIANFYQEFKETPILHG